MAKKCELCGNKEVKVYFCPRCKSPDVRFIFSWKNLVGILPRQKCFKCNFEAFGFPQIVISQKKLDELEKKMKSKSDRYKLKNKAGRNDTRRKN